MKGRGHAERGGALLTVLLLVAVISVLAVAALEQLRLSTRLAANGAAIDQARAYALAAEAMTLDRMGVLAGRDTGKTTLAGGWNGRAFAVPLPEGIVSATLFDGGNCFNLNSVAEGLLAGDYAPRELGIRQFIALMEALGIDPTDSRRVAASLADWIDADAAPNPDGAEDDFYLQSATPYRAANTLLGDVSELRAVAGVTPEIYRLLRPWVCVLPNTDLSPININTLAMDQAPLIAMLMPQRIDLNRARQILAQRPADGWNSSVDFWNLFTARGDTPDMEAMSQVSLRTRWFRLELDVEIGGAQLSETALIDGALAPARIVARSWGSDE
ncbi:type II secretion system minor pseudopilin GspK [Sphingomonas fennica]|uniref:Type II secretion system protein K n=1 Tax=Edaphosphingomonas fennica TaxID=114404 RepID=A0A2T4HN23_9SPHN|nr:type II secretion system minor pseudopilin GspK [Sphingomonas fennica]PTD17212.1 general secretion pathway protein GspK [Sphingomonas fennica]